MDDEQLKRLPPVFREIVLNGRAIEKEMKHRVVRFPRMRNLLADRREQLRYVERYYRGKPRSGATA